MTNTKPVGTILLDASFSNIATGSWTVITTRVVLAARLLQLFNTTGSTLAISTGLPGFEAASILPYTILQGISGDMITIEIPSGLPLSVKALDTASTAGILVLNLFA